MRKVVALLPVFLVFNMLLSLPSAIASSTPEQERLNKDETARELDALTPQPKKQKKAFYLNFGGWLSSTYRDYKNNDHDSSTEDTITSSWFNEARLWAMLSYYQKYILYLRIKDSYIKRNTGSQYTGIGDDNAGPSLDNAYLKLNFKAFDKAPSDLTLGRQYLYIGRGISYSDINDGLKFTFRPPGFFVKGLLTHTLPNEDNVDTSVPNYEKNGKRLFLGTELSYTGLVDPIFYIYGLMQRDRTDKNPIPTQDYRYNSEYYGAGLEGRFKKNINYWLEAIKEKGKGFTDAGKVNLEKTIVDAWALDAGIRYEIDRYLHPACELEYAWGSGDKDRTSVINTRAGGNIYGSDKNFLYFGSFFSGYALSPRLSNLRIYKVDLSIKPLEKFRLCKNIYWGAKYFIYRKDVAGGGIYDTYATQPDKDVGSEIDTYLYWRPSPNIYLSFRYGIFYPGDAYPVVYNDKTKYFYARLMITF